MLCLPKQKCGFISMYSNLTSLIPIIFAWTIFTKSTFSQSCWSNSNQIQEKNQRRLIGILMESIDTVGPQMCVNECSKRNCKSVNYRADTLECELNSQDSLGSSNGTMFQEDPGYVFITVSTVPIDENMVHGGEVTGGNGKEENYYCTTLKSQESKFIEALKQRDCKDLRRHGSSTSGVYTMYPAPGVVINSYCDMTTDGGGWTAFQRRMNGDVDFFRTWADYKNGFGNIGGNYWLGNDNLHLLLSNGESEMRFDMEDFNNNTRYLQYSTFTVGNETSRYVATLSGPSGNVADCLTSGLYKIQNSSFYTKDRDTEIEDCANTYKGGWWYGTCHCANPNGLYLSGSNWRWAEGIVYDSWLGHYYSLKSVELKVRRKQ